MAQEVIFSKNSLKDRFPNHFEIVKEVQSINNRMISRLYNDPRLTTDKFLESVKRHYPNLTETDKIYFYTNQHVPKIEQIEY
jgi:hypothetical protein|tara:strand:- start:77 stop:322 length:246 start_codon:yes stop_codon:yes gene_type:complete